jgi:CheY-like chemotaxis protein
LLIDDADDVRILARKILEVDGAIVSEASSVDEGILKGRSQVPHLILIDLNMPGKTGFDYLDFRLGDPLFRPIPTIVFSGLKDRESVQRALSLGADDYIVKPFRATLMLQKVRKALRLSSFYSRKIPAEENALATFSISGEILQMNEFGCVLESPVKFGPEEDLQIKSDFLREVGAEEFRMRSTISGGKFREGGRYTTEVTFIGIDREVSAKLRSKLGSRK